MKKKIHIIVFLVLSFTIFSADVNYELKNTFKSIDMKKSSSELSGKVDVKIKEEDFYSQITLRGNYINKEGNIEIERGYTEIYRDKLSLSIGRQRIAWGAGYLFNYADTFNEPDPLDPKGDKKGVDSAKARYDLTDTSKIEILTVQNMRDKLDYAARYTFTLGKFEVMGNYIRVTSEKLNSMLTAFPDAYILNEYAIIETRGEFIVGLWGEIIYKRNIKENLPETISAMFEKEEKIGVIGSDYTISLGEGSDSSIYILGEYSYNDTTKDRLLYGQIKYTATSDVDIITSVLSDISKGAHISNTALNYTMNDYVITTVGYTKYINAEKSKYIENSVKNNEESEAYLTFKVNF